jgi:hypothetical protein
MTVYYVTKSYATAPGTAEDARERQQIHGEVSAERQWRLNGRLDRIR